MLWSVDRQQNLFKPGPIERIVGRAAVRNHGKDPAWAPVEDTDEFGTVTSLHDDAAHG